MRFLSIMGFVAVLCFVNVETVNAQTNLTPSDPKTCTPPTPPAPPAPTPDPTFTDTKGIQWKRHVLTEPRKDQRTLLLVVDEALNKNVLSKVVLRKSFKGNEKHALNQAMIKARHISKAPSPSLLVPTNNPIWPIDRAWTDQDELDFNNWVHKTANSDYLIGSGVEVDCADYAIVLRWIYAHDHHLPAGDSLAATFQLFGSWQSTTAWDLLATDADWRKDKRFKAALKYVLALTFTHSIFTDMYPVAITPEFVTPGTVYLTLETDSGHARTIFVSGPSRYCEPAKDCMMIIWGNEPSSEQGYTSDLVPYKVAADGGGFMRFRWPELTATGWQLRPAQNMRGYSTEQYDWDEGEYLLNVSNRLGLWNSPEQRYTATGDSLATLLIRRSHITKIGYVLCSLIPCAPTDSLYNSYSTPVRDNAIAKVIKVFQSSAAQLDPRSDTVRDMKEIFSNIPPFDGSPFSFYDIMNGNINTRFNSDPSTDFFTRWGAQNISDDGKVLANLDLAASVFGNFRYKIVMDAQALCFPNAGTAPECNPCDPKVKALNTERVDQGLRLLRTIFRDAYAKATPATRREADAQARNMEFGKLFCGSAGCSMYDFLLGPVDHWATMTSNADSPIRKRFGY